MIERALLLAIIAAAVLVICLTVRWRSKSQRAALVGTSFPTARLGSAAGRGPAIAYFFGPHCGPCDQQARVLDELRESGRARVLSFDATREPALTEALKIATVPSTVVLDAAGRVHSVNLGFQPAEKLLSQLRHSSDSADGAPVRFSPRLDQA